MQRVAPHLYLRGRNYTFRRAIPEHARSAFGGIPEYVRSLGDVSLRKAEEQAAVHRAYCSRMIEEAAGRQKGKAGVSDLLRIKRVPDREEIEQAVRLWLREHEADGEPFAAAGRQAATDHVRDLRLLNEAVRETMQARRGSAPLITGWIADHLVEAQG